MLCLISKTFFTGNNKKPGGGGPMGMGGMAGMLGGGSPGGPGKFNTVASHPKRSSRDLPNNWNGTQDDGKSSLSKTINDREFILCYFKYLFPLTQG